jgi:hypothetical protein
MSGLKNQDNRWFAKVDVSEQKLMEYDDEVLKTLLADRTTGKNILWGTDDYCRSENDTAYAHDSQMTAELITGDYDGLIKPRAKKSRNTQKARSKDKAEVFTPAWICNAQNNLIDEAWFGYKNPFNAPNSSKKSPHEYTVAPRKKYDKEQKVKFLNGKDWKEYVVLNRMEVTCGEAPYLVNRYDSDSTAVQLRTNVKLRVGLLDRKMRVICENTSSEEEWLEYTKKAYQHTYGFEWQGDNLLLARENMLFSLFDYYQFKFGKDKELPIEYVREIANIISWNLWQMDGITLQVIYTPGPRKEYDTLFEENNDTFCKIMDWDKGEVISFASLKYK